MEKKRRGEIQTWVCFDPAKGQPALEPKIGGNKSKITNSRCMSFTIHHSPFTIHTIV